MNSEVNKNDSTAEAINRVLKQDEASQQAVINAKENADQQIADSHACVTQIERRTEERIAKIHQHRKARLKQALKEQHRHYHEYQKLAIGDSEQQLVDSAVNTLIEELLGTQK